jgi:hypothetical protein
MTIRVSIVVADSFASRNTGYRDSVLETIIHFWKIVMSRFACHQSLKILRTLLVDPQIYSTSTLTITDDDPNKDVLTNFPNYYAVNSLTNDL